MITVEDCIIEAGQNHEQQADEIPVESQPPLASQVSEEIGVTPKKKKQKAKLDVKRRPPSERIKIAHFKYG